MSYSKLKYYIVFKNTYEHLNIVGRYKHYYGAIEIIYFRPHVKKKMLLRNTLIVDFGDSFD